MIPGDLLSAFPHTQFHTLPGLLDSWAALPNSNPNACMPMQGGSLYHFYDGLWYDPAERRTHDLLCERRTRYSLSQPNTVLRIITFHNFSFLIFSLALIHLSCLNFHVRGSYLGGSGEIVQHSTWKYILNANHVSKNCAVVVQVAARKTMRMEKHL